VKFLLDVCVSSRTLTAFLVAQGHDVVSALAIDPSASDERLMALALQEDRVLLTEDKDFGELVFVQARPHGPLVRVVELSVDEQVRAGRRTAGTAPTRAYGACDCDRHAGPGPDSPPK
jgi:predicted nuclease of predicted toxin-antitoxin system